MEEVTEIPKKKLAQRQTKYMVMLRRFMDSDAKIVDITEDVPEKRVGQTGVVLRKRIIIDGFPIKVTIRNLRTYLEKIESE